MKTKNKFSSDGSDTGFSCQILSKTCLHNKISLIEELQKQRVMYILRPHSFGSGDNALDIFSRVHFTHLTSRHSLISGLVIIMLEELGHESVSTLRILSVCNTIYHDLGNACAGKSVQQNMLQT